MYRWGEHCINYCLQINIIFISLPRTRHWDQLVLATRVSFTMTDETRLKELLSLNLHDFEDEVQNIVDKACKELAMEKLISELNSQWNMMSFSKENHVRTGCCLLRANEEMIELLEENQVQLHNMMTSKFVGHFQQEISSWQRLLGLVDNVTTLLMDTQRTWSHLESIFIGSEDIRHQLPAESELFDATNEKFQNLMKALGENPNILLATRTEGLTETLELIQGEMGQCEKALTDYLETKRLLFPRFYFLSSLDLLDILSNGNEPLMVAKHLIKLFDSLAKISLADGDGTDHDEPTRANKMIAKDGEIVSLVEPVACVGQVEKWLDQLMSSMRGTLRNELRISIQEYDDTPREQWLFNYPAQVSLEHQNQELLLQDYSFSSR